MGYNNDVSRGQLDAPAVPQPHVGAAFGNKVVDDQVPRARSQVRCNTDRAGSAKAPRGRELAVEEECALQPYGPQHLGKHVHLLGPPVASAKHTGRSVKCSSESGGTVVSRPTDA